MGEAKRRKQTDPTYGMKPKSGRGIVVSSQIQLYPNNRVYVKDSDIHPIELRRAVLFWDRISWPRNNILAIDTNQPEVLLLQDEGILERPKISLPGGQLADVIWQCQVAAFRQHEQRDPGCWCISEGPESLLRHERDFRSNRGALFELKRAIPIPTAEAPMQDILEFKSKRQDEVAALYSEIDDLFLELIKSDDLDFGLRAQCRKIEKACADLIKVSKESRLPFRLSSQEINYSIDWAKVAWRSIGGLLAGELFEFDSVAALVGGGLTGVSLKNEGRISFTRKNGSNSPFRFVGSLHKEFI